MATLPNPNPIPNDATTQYSYVVDPSIGPVSQSNKSNIATTQVNMAQVSAIKTVDKVFADVGDTLNYTIALTNTGNTAANNAILIDTIPNGSRFIVGSVKINSTPVSGDPQVGISMGIINPGQTTTLTFQVTVTTLPNPNPMANNAQANFRFTLDPSLPDAQIGVTTTNFVNTRVNTAIINGTSNIKKQVDKVFAQVGDTLIYTIAMNNTGTTTALTVVFKDTIPNGTAFVPGSVTINGTPNLGNPGSGISIGNIGAGTVTTVIFQVIVNTVPNINPIPNSGSVNYSYIIDPILGTTGSGFGNSNTVTTQINQAIIDNKNGGGLNKAVSQITAKINDTLTYTITAKNTGTTTANNVVFSDTIPNGTTFVASSVLVNGIPNTGNPGTGISIGNIGVGNTTTVIFKVLVYTMPLPNPIPNNGTVNYTYTVNPSLPDAQVGKGNTNTINTQVNQAIIDNSTLSTGFVKIVDKVVGNTSDTLTYIFSVKNTGNVTADNVVFTDTIPDGTTFIPNSVLVNGASVGGNPQDGINLGNLVPNVTTTVLFKVVTSATLPQVNPIPDNARVSYNFTSDPSVPNGANGSGKTNTVFTQINSAIIDYKNGQGLIKSVDKSFTTINDTLTYTISLQNTGNTTADNIFFSDTIPTGTTFVPNSFTVGGIANTGNPQTGVNIGNLGIGVKLTVSYRVIVITTPTPNPIPNSGTVNYTYTTDSNFPDGSKGMGNTNIVFSQYNAAVIDYKNGNGLIKSVNKAGTKIGDTLTYTSVLKNTGTVVANNVIFTDTSPNGTTFVPGSLSINAVANPGDPTVGINVGNIIPNQVVTVAFNVVVVTLPSPNPSQIPNTSGVSYTYTMDPSVPNGANGVGTSNLVITSLNQAIIDAGSGGYSKSVSQNYATLGDTFTYTLILKNTGTTIANNVIFTDTAPNGTAFIPGTFSINGISNAGNPSSGVNIGSLLPGQVATLAFRVSVITIPTVNPIPNAGTTTFTYTADPSVPNGETGGGNSNTVLTKVNVAIIDNKVGGGLIKSVSQTTAKIGDTLVYTSTLRNTGTTTANNVIFLDTVPNGTNFVTGSVVINGITNGGNPAVGINVGNIGPNQAVTVTFKALVTLLTTPNPMPNTSAVVYTYTVDPSVPDGKIAGGLSNTVNTQVNQAAIDTTTGGLTKLADKAYANVGDIITYTIGLKNTGNVSANNVVLIDTIPNGTTFVTGSVTVNGALAASNPQTGINVGSIPPSNVVTVTFKVVVGGTLPVPNPIPNAGKVAFTFTSDPSVPNGANGTGNSNIVNTQVNAAIIDYKNGQGLIKAVDKTFTTLGDTLTYTVTLNNKGNVIANNLFFSDTIPTGTLFVPNSLTVGGISNAGNPQTGINIGSLAVATQLTISYQVVTVTTPVPNPIPNNGTVTYTYTTDPSVPNGSNGIGNTNTVFTQYNAAVIDNKNGNGLIKAVDKAYTKIGDTLTYTSTLENTGTVVANNVIFTDTAPNGTAFIPGTLSINGVANPGSPVMGINVGNIVANQVVTVAFSVVVTSVPSPVPTVIPNTNSVMYTYTIDPSVPNGATGTGTSNQVITNFNQAIIDTGSGGYSKGVTPKYATLGDTVTYTLALKNTGTATANNVIFTDTAPNGTAFIPGSVTVGNTPNTGNPGAGINIGTIVPGQTTTVIFSVVVITIPLVNPIPNTGTTSFTYTMDPSVPNGAIGGGNSNTVTTQVNAAVIDNKVGGGLVKTVNKVYTTVGDTLTYAIVLKNTGTVTANNVVFTDTIPGGTVFVPGSFTINGIANSGNPAIGVNVGSIPVGSPVTLGFQVVVTTVPTINPIPNQGAVSFLYTVDPSLPNGRVGSGLSNVVTSQVNQGVIDNNSGGYSKTASKSYADIGDTVTYTLTLKNTGNVTVNNVVLIDTVPNGSQFIPNSVIVNSTPNTGNPQTGISLGSFGPNQGATVTFSILVITIPNPNPMVNKGSVTYNYTVDPRNPNGQQGSGSSNGAQTKVNHADISNGGGGLNKSADVVTAAIGDTITYTIGVANTGNVPASNVILKDTIPVGTVFIPNSVTINSIGQSGVNPQTGITLGTIVSGTGNTITFKVKVVSIPATNPIPNQANVGYSYIVDPSSPVVNASNLSNIARVQINSAVIDNAGGGLAKAVDKAYGDLGSTLTYTIQVKNTGNVPADNVVLFDTIPQGTSLVPGSVTVGGAVQSGANPQTGISLNSIAPGISISITFKVLVNSVTIPVINPVPNNSVVTFTFNKC